MASAKQQISLSLTSSYASSWGLWEGIRELVQNWHDGIYEAFEHVNAVETLTLGREVVFIQKDTKGYHFEALARKGKNDNLQRQPGDVLLGSLHFNTLQNKLHLVNKLTSLEKKILLLGYSKKSDKREVIGQFGEGLKVGALALVREGRLVSMATGIDKWYFDLSFDGNFGEKVLTVFVTDRLKEKDDPLNDDDYDTFTTVSLDTVEWEEFYPRFLFLSPPKEFIKTQAGQLLLDPEHSSQLYVKGVWVADLTAEDLYSGVDFASLQLDRDRNAVPRPSEIDQLVSCFWVKAVSQRPDLADRYFNLLMQGKHRDVKHTLQYADDQTALAIAEVFRMKYGEDVFPLPYEPVQHDYDAVRKQLRKNVVMCNSTVLQLLHKSGLHVPLEVALSNHRAQNTMKIPIVRLSSKQRDILVHGVKLVQMLQPDFGTSCVDIVEDNSLKSCLMNGDRVQVPLWFLSLPDVHNNCKKLCSGNPDQKCLCCEVHLCSSILYTIPKEAASTTGDPLLYMVQHLALQLCNQATETFCTDYHRNLDSYHGQVEHEDCAQREEKLQRRITDLEIELASSRDKQKADTQKVYQELQKLEKDLTTREVNMVNEESRLRTQFETQMGKAKAMAEDKIYRLQQEVSHQQEINKTLRKQINQLEEKNERKEENQLDELLYYIDMCKTKGEMLRQMCQNRLEEYAEDGKLLEQYKLAAEMLNFITDVLQKEKLMCAVCLAKRKEVLLVPCNHYHLCESCSLEIISCSEDGSKPRCPTCKAEIETYIKVYE